MNAYQLEELNDLPTEREFFYITDTSSLTWAFRKLKAIRAKEEETRAVAQAEISLVTAWRDAELRKTESDRVYFESLISDFANRQRFEKGENKHSTPHGTVKFHRQQAKWEYDDSKLLESLKSAGRTDLIRVKEEPNKVDLKNCCIVKDGQVIDKETGAVLEGVSVHEQPDKLVIDYE